MALREEFNEAMKEAMKAKEARRLSTIRLMLAALKDSDIANRTEDSREGIGDDEIRLHAGQDDQAARGIGCDL